MEQLDLKDIEIKKQQEEIAYLYQEIEWWKGKYARMRNLYNLLNRDIDDEGESL